MKSVHMLLLHALSMEHWVVTAAASSSARLVGVREFIDVDAPLLRFEIQFFALVLHTLVGA